MSELVAVQPSPPVDRSPVLVALDADAPRLEDLFTFMVDAELRVQTLRMRVEERVGTSRGEELSIIELVLRHPGHARITTRREATPLARDYRIWASDGRVVTTYDAQDERASIRPVRPVPVGATDPGRPRFAQVYSPRTALPATSVIDTMVHPHGLIRNRLLTGPVALVGTTHLAGGRETLVLRSQHPRTSHVLTDRPDRWIEVGVDRMTGFVTLLSEHVGDRLTLHAQAISLETDALIQDAAFAVSLPADVRMIYEGTATLDDEALDDLERASGDDPETIAAVLERYLDQVPRWLGRMDRHQTTGDGDGAAAAAALASSSRTLGAHALADRADRLAVAFERDDPRAAGDLMATHEAALELTTAIRERLAALESDA